MTTPTKEITIAGQTFVILQPYLAGHTVTEAEARALNQVRAENVRNNMASKVKAAYEGTAKEGEPTVDEIAAFVAEYDAAYEFTLASVGGGKRPTDPVEVEALRMARGYFADFCAGKKLTVKAVREKIGEDAYEAKIAEIAAREETQKEAKRRVKVRQASAENAMGDLDLGELSVAAADEPAH
jgi:hypothetical protein